MNSLKLFGKRIKELRKKNNLTQEQLAEKLGVFQKQVGNIETGTTFTTMVNLEKLADVFGLEIKDLFEYDYQKSSEELVDEIIILVKKCPEDKLKLVYRVLKDILF